MSPSAWVNTIINNIINIIVWPVFGGAVVIMFIFAGFKFLTAQGDPGKLGDARRALIWALVGALVGLVAFSIIQTISTLIIPTAP